MAPSVQAALIRPPVMESRHFTTSHVGGPKPASYSASLVIPQPIKVLSTQAANAHHLDRCCSGRTALLAASPPIKTPALHAWPGDLARVPIVLIQSLGRSQYSPNRDVVPACALTCAAPDKRERWQKNIERLYACARDQEDSNV
eukprot:6196922-Pleurochrysis_carterae.AAC.1